MEQIKTIKKKKHKESKSGRSTLKQVSLAFGASFFLEASVDSNGGDGESQKQSGIFKTQESEEQKLRRGTGGDAGGEPCPKPPLIYG